MTPRPLSSFPFSLRPFTAKSSASPGSGPIAPTANLSIEGSIAIEAELLEVTYRLIGDLELLEIPPAAAVPQRRDPLWQTTCLELFLARQGADEYWEFNLSPAGHWNVYHLEGYRQGLLAEPAYQELPFQLTRSTQELGLALRCALPPALLCPDTQAADGASALEVGITAVVEEANGPIGYWALHHPATEADFHHRGGFCLRFP